jgi:transcriptional regulator with XRE-family HTH domain
VKEAGDKRKELGLFLRARRDQALRSEYGLPPVARRRERGLRREEVAFLSGVSVTWYTWLEQGRDIRPSREVLEAVARTLHLSETGRSYVLSLGGYSAPVTAGPVAADAPAHIQRLLDALGPNPAFALAPDWSVTGWNRAYAALYPNIANVAAPERNLLWLVFTDPYVRELLPDWDVTSRQVPGRVPGGSRAAARRPGPDVPGGAAQGEPARSSRRAGTGTTSSASNPARTAVPPPGGRRPAGWNTTRSSPSDRPDLHIVVYTPAPDS